MLRGDAAACNFPRKARLMAANLICHGPRPKILCRRAARSCSARWTRLFDRWIVVVIDPILDLHLDKVALSTRPLPPCTG
jgi:hypothetical protein